MPRAINPDGIRKNNTQFFNDHDAFRVALHGTVIFQDYGTHAELYTGGYNTPTTIRRMNECLHHRGYSQRVCKADFVKDDSIEIIKNKEV
jgi:hypothetical protein